MEMFIVGGFVRDQLIGEKSKDVDFCVVVENAASVDEAFSAMREHLLLEGFSIHVERPEFLTIRAGVPGGHPLRWVARDADFVVAREDGTYSDGRRPDSVRPGSLYSDLSRRDFTVNAIARDPLSGDLIDPHGGQADLAERVLRFVGDPSERIAEDGLRVVRGFRFMVTKGLTPTVDTWDALCSREAAQMLRLVAVERIREEVEHMVAFDTLGSLHLLGSELPALTRSAIFRHGLRLSATLAR